MNQVGHGRLLLIHLRRYKALPLLFDEPSEFPTARLFNVQAIELGSSPADTPGSQLSRSILDLLHAQTLRLQAMNDEIDSARHALSERKTIERAKGELMAK